MSAHHRTPCQHKILLLETSPFAEEAGFERPAASRRLAATTKAGRAPGKNQQKSIEAAASSLSQSFPGPLVLPHDDLNYDPDWPPQSFRSWLKEAERNKPTKQRQTLYVAAVPEITPAMAFMKEWMKPVINFELGGPLSKKAKTSPTSLVDLVSPDTKDFVDYLHTFYHGLSVKQFSQRLRWVPWKEKGKGSSKSNSSPKYVGLGAGDQSTRIRVRPSPDGLFKGQLNLDDILDAAIAMLPDDAYSIILLVDHDIYEGEDDDFCCGRAYGGSRIAVVQTARYHPILDNRNQIDHEHMWPSSHCKDFVDELCVVEDIKPKHATSNQIQASQSGPIRAAISAATAISDQSSTENPRALWFSRLARTVAHELGHCLGMDHCVYYACNMQGTGSMAEDVRQPPYLCPVCLSKVSYAVSCELLDGNEEIRKEYIKERYEAIAGFCGRWEDVGLFTGYGAWVRARLGELEKA